MTPRDAHGNLGLKYIMTYGNRWYRLQLCAILLVFIGYLMSPALRMWVYLFGEGLCGKAGYVKHAVHKVSNPPRTVYWGWKRGKRLVSQDQDDLQPYHSHSGVDQAFSMNRSCYNQKNLFIDGKFVMCLPKEFSIFFSST